MVELARMMPSKVGMGTPILSYQGHTHMHIYM